MRISSRTVLLESVVAAALATGLAMVLSPSDASLSLGGPHIIWLAVLVVAARYGTRGLAFAMPVSWGMLTLATMMVGRLPVLLARVDGGADLVALVATVLVAWVAGVHEQRFADATTNLVAARERAAAEQAITRELKEAFSSLRARADRLELSLTFLRDVSSRIETGDAASAGAAALELVMARSGARGGVVQLSGLDGAPPATLSWNGVWSSDSTGAAPDLDSDQTVASALRSRRPVRAIDLSHATSSDSDLAAPLMDASGATCGVVALRGVPLAGASLATVHDLGVVAMWLSRSLARREPLVSRFVDNAYAEIEIGGTVSNLERLEPATPDRAMAMLPERQLSASSAGSTLSLPVDDRVPERMEA